MTKAIKTDFESLRLFINDFDLKESFKDEDFQKITSTYHKKYFSYLTFVEELAVATTGKNKVLGEEQQSFLRESCSDCGQAFFLLMCGCYKGMRLLLRASIESFIKAISLDEEHNICSIKNVYEVFEKAKGISLFVDKDNDRMKLFHMIHGEYKHLCQDVHIAGKDNMEGISALSYFPAFDKDKSEKVSKIALRLMQCYITILAFKYNEVFHKIGFVNKEIIQHNFFSNYRKAINHIED